MNIIASDAGSAVNTLLLVAEGAVARGVIEGAAETTFAPVFRLVAWLGTAAAVATSVNIRVASNKEQIVLLIINVFPCFTNLETACQ